MRKLDSNLALHCGRQPLPTIVSALVEDLDDTHDMASASTRFQSFVVDCGFVHATTLRFPDPEETFEACSYMSTAPQQWLTQYVAQNFLRIDPLIRHAAKTSTAFFWSNATAEIGTESAVEKIVSERTKLGLNDGLVVPIFGSSFRNGLVSFACGDKPPCNLKSAMVVSAHYFYNKIAFLHQRQTRRNDLLTERELACLKWAAQGKTDWEIGSILGVDSKTVNYRIEKVKKKLGVPTRVQAIVYAIRHCEM